MCDIDINTKKTEVIYNNCKTDTSTLTLHLGIQQNSILILPSHISTKYLGLFIDSKGSFSTQKQKIYADFTTISTLLKRKQIIDKQAIYIINSILYPAFEYKSQLLLFSKTDCEKLMRPLKALVKNKSHLPLHTSNSILHHPKIYNLENLWQVQSRSKISELFYRLNDSGILGKITFIRLQSLQEQRWSFNPILSTPTPEYSQPGKNLIASILTLMYERNISFHHTSHFNTQLTPSQSNELQWPLEDLLGPWPVYSKCRHILKHDKTLSLQQITKYSNNALITWRQYKTRRRKTHHGPNP